MSLSRIVRNVLRRDRVERDLDDELRATVQLLVDEKVRGGMTADEARRAARAEVGALEAIKDNVRDARAGAVTEAFFQDVRFGARLLRRNPLFALTATLSLAIGIGATTAIFTVANGLLLRPAIGVADPERLVDIVRLEEGEFSGVEPISYPDYLDVRRQATTVEQVYGYHLELEPVSLRVTDSAERVFANVVTTNYFEALGVQASFGRVFGPSDGEQPGSSPVAVLSHRFWVVRFHADPTIVGRTVRVNGHPFAIVGVARDGFRGTSVLAPDLWIPTAMVDVARAGSEHARLTVRESGWLMLGARLRDGVSREQASTEIAAIGAGLGRQYPFDPRYLPPGMPPPTFVWSAEPASPVPYGLRAVVAGFAAFLMAIVSTVLAIACANVAGILLTRAVVRRREMAVRAAIGAMRARVVRQLLTETLLLFLVGGAAGLALARVLTSLIVALLPALPVPVSLSLPLDARVAAFSLGIALIAALACGLVPALEASRTNVVSAMKDEGTAPMERLRLRNAFVIAQVAFSALLVIVAAVLIRGFDRVSAVNGGYEPRGVDVASVDLSMAGYTDASGPAFVQQLVERVRALPGVETATVANRAPGPGGMNFGGVVIPGVTPPNGARAFYPNWTLIDSDYFATLRIPFVAGRDFGSGDRHGAERVAIVGEAAARRFWPWGNAIGQFVLLDTGDATGGRVPLRIVGVVRDIETGPSRRPMQSSGGAVLALYVPLQQHYLPQVTILARRRMDRSRAAELHGLVATMDPNLPVLSAQTLESQQGGPIAAQLRVSAGVAAGVGLVGLLLAAMGVYGVTAYTVSRRTREMGIRVSLGAGRREVMRMVLWQGMRLVVIGACVGLLMGSAAGIPLSRRFNIPAADLPLLAAVAALFTAIGLAACYFPTRNAVGVRAMEALRAE